MVEKTAATLAELGNKLRNFRNKLALAIGEKKIKQSVFGEMFGDYSERQISSYESGDVEIPAVLLYSIWLSGNSIDAMFSEGPINEPARHKARELYDRSITASLETIDETELTRLEHSIEEYHAKKIPTGAVKKGAKRYAGNRSNGASTPGKAKKRRSPAR